MLLSLSLYAIIFTCFGQLQQIQVNAPHDPSTHLDDISCDQSTTNPSHPDGCNINCVASSSCGAYTSANAPNLICPPIPNSKCIIHCIGASSCQHATILYSNTDTPLSNISIQLTCSGSNSCQNLTLISPPNSDVTVTCNNAIGDNECSSLQLQTASANSVSLECTKDAVCNHMDIYCPQYSVDTAKNCIINCKGARNCNDNDIYIKENDLDNTNAIGLSYTCTYVGSTCNSYIICDYEDGVYQQQCAWTKLADTQDWNCESDSECHGIVTIGFLSGWQSLSTVVFVFMLGSGFLIVLAIFVYTMKEKCDEFKNMKEKHRKKIKRTNTKRRTTQRRATLLGNDDTGSGNRIYGKGHKLSGSYYAPKKKNIKLFQSSNSCSDMIEEKTEYQYSLQNRPGNIEIIEEYDQYGYIVEEDYDSESLQSDHSQRSQSRSKSKSKKKSKKSKVKKGKKPKISPVMSLSQTSRDSDSENRSKKKSKKKSGKKKLKKLKLDTPVNSTHKMDENPAPLVIQPFDEEKEDDGYSNDKAVIVNVKTKKKKRNFSIESFRRKPKPKLKKDRSDSGNSDSDRSDSQSSKRKKKKRNKSSVEMNAKSKTPKRNVRFQSEVLGKKKVKRKKSKKKERSQSKPLNVINEQSMEMTLKKGKLAKTKSMDAVKSKRKTNKKKVKTPKKQSKNGRKSRKDKSRLKSVPVNEVNDKSVKHESKLHRKTNSLISLGGMFKKSENVNPNDSDEGSTTSTMKYFNVFRKNNKSEEEKHETKPKHKKTRSSPLYQNIKNITLSDFMWESFYASQVYGGALFHAWDIATDFGVIFNWIENDTEYVLIAFSLFSIFLYRFLSAIVLARQFGWQWGIIQFLDLTIYIEAYRSLKNKYCQYTRELKWIRRMEAIFESTPQALLQLGFLLKSPQFITNKEIEPFDILIILSFVSSLMSIAFSVARDDEAHFELDAWPFLVPYFRNRELRDKWYKKHGKKRSKEKDKKEKKMNKSQSYKKEKAAKEKLKAENAKKWVAMYELESCYNNPDEYVQDSVNALWLPNYKYMVRFTFRFTEATARILTLTLFWVAFGGLYICVLCMVALVFYFGLQITGIIGYEWGNMVTFVIVHPNLTLKTDFEKSDRPKLLRFMTAVSGWYPLHKIFGFDMVETHFIHRFLETLAELVIICVGIYALECCGIDEDNGMGGIYNTKQIFFMEFGISLLGLGYVCTLITPILYKFVVYKWIKKGTSLENNLFGLIRLFDVAAVGTFLKKSNRSHTLINSVSAQGYTPLSLAVEIGFYDVFETLLEYGANINEPNRRGETAVFTLAKQRNLSVKFMHKGLKILHKINADFSIVDHNGWSCAFHACEAGNIKFIDFLVNNNMNKALEARDFDARSISHIAALHNQTKLLQQLHKLRKKKKLNCDLLMETDEDGRVPLHYAFEHQSANAAKYLIENNRDSVKIEDMNGDSPLMFGARFCEVPFWQKLKQLKYKNFRVFLIPVCIEGEYDSLKWLLRECQGKSGGFKKLEKYMDKESKRNPLHFACMHGHDRFIPLLARYNFNMNDTDYKHRTAAFFAAQRGHLKCLKALHKLKANFKIENNKRLTPYQIAEENNHYKCVAFLHDKK